LEEEISVEDGDLIDEEVVYWWKLKG